MRAQVGSIWRRHNIAGTTHEVIGFTSDDKIRVRAVEYPASQVVAYYYEDFHRNFTQIKPALTAPASLVVPGSVWKSQVNVRQYEVISVASGFVRFQSKHTSSVTGKTYKYTYDMPRFLRTMRLESAAPEAAVQASRNPPEIGSVWETPSGSMRYVVTGVDVDRGNPNDPRWWDVSFTVQGKNPAVGYRYNAEKFWSLLRFVEPAAPNKWAEVERTLRLYNAANRKTKRLEAVLAETFEATTRARAAIDEHRKVANKASAAYGDALRVMEDSVK